MAPDPIANLSDRQRELLALVIEEYVATGQPVGSRYLVERGSLSVSASTVRNELAELEGRGFLTHPHTSAGRIPTEQGYRLYAGGILARHEPQPAGRLPARPLGAAARDRLRARGDDRRPSRSVTSQLALVSAPPLETTTRPARRGAAAPTRAR